jgi:hypothetical protein
MKNSSSELFEMFETFEKTIETKKDFMTKRLKQCIYSTNVLNAGKKNVREKRKLIIEKCLILLKQTYTFDKFCYYHMRWLINNLNLMINQLNENVYVNDYILLMLIVYALIIWRWTSRRTIDFEKIIDSFVSRMSWDHINSFIKIDRNLFSTLQRFKSTYFFNNDVNDSRQIIWCCRNFSINDLIKRFRCLNAQNIILRKSFWKNLKCINIICDESINAKTTIDYETCFILSINNWCDKVHCIIDDTWNCDSINIENWSIIHITKNMSWKKKIFFRHIDQNISQLISFEHDVNMIQDILSLNDENISNYIVIFFDMHYHLSFW